MCEKHETVVRTHSPRRQYLLFANARNWCPPWKLHLYVIVHMGTKCIHVSVTVSNESGVTLGRVINAMKN